LLTDCRHDHDGQIAQLAAHLLNQIDGFNRTGDHQTRDQGIDGGDQGQGFVGAPGDDDGLTVVAQVFAIHVPII